MPITCDKVVGEDCNCAHWIRIEILRILVYNMLYFAKRKPKKSKNNSKRLHRFIHLLIYTLQKFVIILH